MAEGERRRRARVGDWQTSWGKLCHYTHLLTMEVATRRARARAEAGGGPQMQGPRTTPRSHPDTSPPRIATRKHYLRQEMTLGRSGGNCPSHLSILTVSALPRQIGPASLHPQAPELHCGCAGCGVGAAAPPCPEVRWSCEVPQ